MKQKSDKWVIRGEKTVTSRREIKKKNWLFQRPRLILSNYRTTVLIINNAIKVHYRHYILHEELDGHRQADQIVQAQPGKRERLATYKCPRNHQKS